MKMRVSQLGSAFVVGLFGQFITPQVALAQYQFPCTGGAVGEQLIGMHPGLPGQPSIPICVSTDVGGADVGGAPEDPVGPSVSPRAPRMRGPSIQSSINLINSLTHSATRRAEVEKQIGRFVYRSPEGWWNAVTEGDREGYGCAFAYTSSAPRTDYMIFEGPRRTPQGISRGRFIFMGLRVPAVTRDTNVRLTLKSDDGSAQTVNAILVPTNMAYGGIVIPTNMIATMRASTETKWMAAEVNRNEVFRTNIVGNLAIVNPMLRCMKQDIIPSLESQPRP